MPTISSPKTVKPTRLVDKDVGYSYVEFPSDTIFLESMATNSNFRPGVAFVPVQRVVGGVEESHLYEIRPGMTNATHVAGPIAASDGSTDVTVFGSALTSKGTLFLCAFNRNSIMAFDLTRLPEESETMMLCEYEVPAISSPNDVCFDPMDESTLYVAGGTFRTLCCSMQFSNSAYGTVYKVNLQDTKTPMVTVQTEGLKTLAGVEVVGSKIWIAQLYDMLHLDKDQILEAPTVTWKGNDENGNVWLADNIDMMGDKILCPAYSTVPSRAVEKVLKRSFILSSAVFGLQLATAWTRKERLRAAIRDPEVSLSFSNTYLSEKSSAKEIPDPVRLIVIDPKDATTHHFEVDLQETRERNKPWAVKDPYHGKLLGKRHFFNEQVTHAGHLLDGDGRGYIICVNFEQPRILFLEDRVFKESMMMPV